MSSLARKHRMEQAAMQAPVWDVEDQLLFRRAYQVGYLTSRIETAIRHLEKGWPDLALDGLRKGLEHIGDMP